jgi:hypothetical protein
MSFLDNLEDNLKSLEKQDERDPDKARRVQERREAERTAALRRAPHVETLKSSPFTSDLLTECRTIGHGQRVLVQFTWIGENLRLDAKAKRLELIPTAEGITAVFSVDGVEVKQSTVDVLNDDAAALARSWLTGN